MVIRWWAAGLRHSGTMLRRWFLIAAGIPCLMLGQWATALPLQQGGTNCPDRKLCDFLSLPGIWDHIGQHPTYQILDPCCQLRDYVSEVLVSPEEPVSTQDTHHGILFLGDSVDRFQLAVICEEELLRSTGSPHETDSYWACKRGPFSFHLQAMAGVHPSGPYHLNMNGVPRDRIIHAVTHYSQVTNTVPDMVVYTSLFWDIGRNDDYFPERLANASLPTEYLLEWCEHFRAVLRAAKAQTSSAKFHIYKTTVMPMEDCDKSDGTFVQPKIGKRGHVAAMTAIAMQVAKEEGWGILNMDSVVAQLPPATLFLPDGFHPQVYVGFAGLNVLLNLLTSPLGLTRE